MDPIQHLLICVAEDSGEVAQAAQYQQTGFNLSEGKIIHREPLQIGGHTVRTELPAGYEGPCAVLRDGCFSEIICAFPDSGEAIRAAKYAVKADCGYGAVFIAPCTKDQVTHAEFVDWAF